MLSPALLKLQRIRNGERVVVDDEDLDAFGDDVVHDLEILTCLNAKRLGLRGKYVAWIGEKNSPKDLRYDAKSGYQFGSA